jgi:hypothetical protein
VRKSKGINTYSGAHENTRRERGEAAQFTCPCGDPAREWAYKHGSQNEMRDSRGLAFSLDPMDYKAMCRRCHRLYDKAQITACPQGHPYDVSNTLLDAGKRKCRICVYARNTRRRISAPMTPEQKERKLHLQRIRRAAARGETA